MTNAEVLQNTQQWLSTRGITEYEFEAIVDRVHIWEATVSESFGHQPVNLGINGLTKEGHHHLFFTVLYPQGFDTFSSLSDSQRRNRLGNNFVEKVQIPLTSLRGRIHLIDNSIPWEDPEGLSQEDWFRKVCEEEGSDFLGVYRIDPEQVAQRMKTLNPYDLGEVQPPFGSN